MEKKKTFQREILNIAIPVALQSLLSSSFSVVDQIMTGQLGKTSIAGIGLAGKFAGLHSVVLGAVATAAGILLAQYLGKRDQKAAERSFFLNLILALVAAAAFTVVCESVPKGVMGLYTTDADTRDCAARYLQIIALGFLPSAGSLLLSTFLRCKDRANIPLYATLFNAALNTGLNYVLIFGKFGFPAMGVSGAAWATVISQYVGFLVILSGYLRLSREAHWKLLFPLAMSKEMWHQYLRILAPILVCEFFWGLGENVYAAIYGHIGTGSCAAMTLISPVVVLFIGALSGVSQAAGILIGKRQRAGAFEEAYALSKKLMWYGLTGSLCLSAVLVLLGQRYVQIFRVEDSGRRHYPQRRRNQVDHVHGPHRNVAVRRSAGRVVRFRAGPAIHKECFFSVLLCYPPFQFCKQPSVFLLDYFKGNTKPGFISGEWQGIVCLNWLRAFSA